MGNDGPECAGLRRGRIPVRTVVIALAISIATVAAALLEGCNDQVTSEQIAEVDSRASALPVWKPGGGTVIAVRGGAVGWSGPVAAVWDLGTSERPARITIVDFDCGQTHQLSIDSHASHGMSSVTTSEVLAVTTDPISVYIGDASERGRYWRVDVPGPDTANVGKWSADGKWWAWSASQERMLVIRTPAELRDEMHMVEFEWLAGEAFAIVGFAPGLHDMAGRQWFIFDPREGALTPLTELTSGGVLDVCRTGDPNAFVAVTDNMVEAISLEDRERVQQELPPGCRAVDVSWLDPIGACAVLCDHGPRTDELDTVVFDPLTDGALARLPGWDVEASSDGRVVSYITVAPSSEGGRTAARLVAWPRLTELPLDIPGCAITEIDAGGSRESSPMVDDNEVHWSENGQICAVLRWFEAPRPERWVFFLHP